MGRWPGRKGSADWTLPSACSSTGSHLRFDFDSSPAQGRAQREIQLVGRGGHPSVPVAEEAEAGGSYSSPSLGCEEESMSGEGTRLRIDLCFRSPLPRDDQKAHLHCPGESARSRFLRRFLRRDGRAASFPAPRRPRSPPSLGRTRTEAPSEVRAPVSDSARGSRRSGW